MPWNARIPLLQEIKEEVISSLGLQLFMLRLDLLHPHISGNKWYKLKYNLEAAKKLGKNTLLTFGGAYSNHIIATAAAAKQYGFKSIGIIRGDEKRDLNERLRFARDCGMHLHVVSREEYRTKNTPEFRDSLQRQFGDFYLIPEGGANELAVKGCEEILEGIDISFDIVCCACGTGTTLAGVALSLKKDQAAIGFSSLKGGSFLEEEVKGYTGPESLNWSIQTDYHFGGYAKTTPGLLDFITQFDSRHGIVLDHVYTGKMVYGILDLAANKRFVPGTKLIAIHTGGIFSP